MLDAKKVLDRFSHNKDAKKVYQRIAKFINKHHTQKTDTTQKLFDSNSGALKFKKAELRGYSNNEKSSKEMFNHAKV